MKLVSNALLERIFSLVTSAEAKARYRLQLQMLEAIVGIKAEVLLADKCCKDFKPFPKMIPDGTTVKNYTSENQQIP